MKTKEKANELVEKFEPHADWNNEYGSQEKKSNTKHAIQCAIIAVDEVIDNILSFDPSIDYWQEVKQHLKEML